ncbi:MAG: ABC transporter ATP-binding protein [Oscillospiraceae bacterium]
MKILEVSSLCKEYPQFHLSNVSFSLEKGVIMGFIGKNGAGKTTTIKSLLGLVHPKSGDVRFFGLDFVTSEKEIKQRIGYAAGGIDYYPKKQIRTILKYTKPFFENWDDNACKRYLKLFELDENKRLNELSCGMRVKFSLLLALSHHAELLILDEPTSGLDPVSRDDLLNIFLDLRDKGMSILFSTHITSDLDKCANEITYIHKGRIVQTGCMDTFVSKYRIVKVPENCMTNNLKAAFIGTNRTKSCFTGLIEVGNVGNYQGYEISEPDLEEIMIHMERGEQE